MRQRLPRGEAEQVAGNIPWKERRKQVNGETRALAQPLLHPIHGFLVPVDQILQPVVRAGERLVVCGQHERTGGDFPLKPRAGVEPVVERIGFWFGRED